MGDEVSDAGLVARVRSGDRRAFAVLLGRHVDMVTRVTARVCSAHDSEDVVQEAVIRALLSLDRLREPDDFGPWLAGIALNVARSDLRSSARRGAAMARLPAAMVEPTPEEMVVDLDVSAQVRLAIAHLPSGQREATELYYLACLPQTEVAAALGISSAAARTRLHKARTALRRSLRHLTEESMHTETQTPLVEVTPVRVDSFDGDRRSYAVTLHEKDGDRVLTIFLGGSEAAGIGRRLEDTLLPRPDSWDLMASLVLQSGSKVTEVRVTGVHESTYIGSIVLSTSAGLVEMDARPSDAINIALAMDVPIMAEASLLSGREHDTVVSAVVAPPAELTGTARDLWTYFYDELHVELGAKTVEAVVAAWADDVAVEVVGRERWSDLPRRVISARGSFAEWRRTTIGMDSP